LFKVWARQIWCSFHEGKFFSPAPFVRLHFVRMS
jgi:hypothetical protein